MGKWGVWEKEERKHALDAKPSDVSHFFLFSVCCITEQRIYSASLCVWTASFKTLRARDQYVHCQRRCYLYVWFSAAASTCADSQTSATNAAATAASSVYTALREA